MDTVVLVARIIIALGIVNVWLVRFGKPTEWRGGKAANMKEEFQAYGLPGGIMLFIGALKLLVAAALIVGIWVPELTMPAAIGMAVLMLGAILMHVKVKDPAKRSLPALCMLALSLIVAFA